MIAALAALLAACDTSPPPAVVEPTVSVTPGVRSPTPSASPTATPRPRSTNVLLQGKGTYSQTASGGTGVLGRSGKLHKYCVQVEDGIETFTADEFAAVVDVVLADERSWIAGKKWMFQRVPDCASAQLRIKLTTPKNVDRFCAPTRTVGEYSCRNGGNLFINLKRWMLGVAHYNGDLDNYRTMVINHETGHYLGFGHVNCTRTGDLAPVMQQQSISLRGCQANPHPYPDGVNYVG